MINLTAAIVSLAIALPGQAQTNKPTPVPTMTSAEMNRHFTASAGRSQPITWTTLFAMGVLRVRNESCSLAIVFPTWVDGWAAGWAEMNGIRGGANTENERQSVLDIRFSTNKPNVLHALVIPISRRPTDVQEAVFEVKIGTQTFQKTLVGNKHLFVTWTPTKLGMQGASVKMISPGKFCFSEVLLKYANN